MNKKIIMLALTCLIIFLWTLPSLACEFFFNYQEIKAPLGTIGTIGIRVRKDHQICTLEGMDYQFHWSNIQVLEETDWVQVGTDLYEKRMRVLLNHTGSGFLLISKDCCREGYDEKRLPILVEKGAEVWEKTINGEYPYEASTEIQVISGNFRIEENTLHIGETLFPLPENIHYSNPYEDKGVVYYSLDGEKRLLLVVGENIFHQFSP